MSLKYCKTRDVGSIIRGTGRSAGYDLFVPDLNDKFKNDFLEVNKDSKHYPVIKILNESSMNYARPHIVIPGNTHLLIPAGIKIDIAEFRKSFNFDQNDDSIGFAFIAFNKSSIGKKQLDIAASVVDEDYQGEVHLSVTNTQSHPQTIHFGQKLIQFLLIPVILTQPEECLEHELFKEESERGEGGFGSTNDKVVETPTFFQSSL